jgi:hypothetical protein
LCILLPCLSGLLAAPASAEPVADWLQIVARCSGGAKPLRLGIIGFEPGALPVAAAERVRLSIQAELSKQQGVETAAVRDAELLQSLQEEVLNRATEIAVAQQQLHEAFLQVHALVFFKAPVRPGDGDRVRFQLLAVLPGKLGCTPLSVEVERPLPETRELQDLDARLAKAVADMMDVRNPAPVADVTVCPFENIGKEFSSCVAVLTNLVVQHLDKARRSRSADLTNRIVSIKRAEPGLCTSADTTTHGTVDAQGKRLLMNFDFVRSKEILATTGPTEIFPRDLGCDDPLRTFFDYVRAGAHVDETKLSLHPRKRPFARQDYLGIDIKAGTDLALYCWILGRDRTANLALPVRDHVDHARITKGRTLRYPGGDFDTQLIRLENPSEDLFGCFGSERPLPPELHNSWMNLTGPPGSPIELNLEDILRVLEMMRGQPGIVEGYAQVTVR